MTFLYPTETIAVAKARMLELRRQKLSNNAPAVGALAEELGMRFQDVAKCLSRWPTIHPATTETVGPYNETVHVAPVVRPLQLPSPLVIRSLLDLDDDNTLVWKISRDPAQVGDLFDIEAAWVVIGTWVIEPEVVKAALINGEWPDQDEDTTDADPSIRRTDYDRQRALLNINAEELEANAA